MAGSRTLALLLASAAAFAGAAPAAASPGASPALASSKTPSGKNLQLASDLVKKAIARSQAGDHGAAIKIYLQAYTLVPNSLLLSNIGAEFQQDGMYKEALDYFCKYLEQDPAGTNAPYARAQAKILQRQLGRKKVDERDVCAMPEDTEDVAEDPSARSEKADKSDKPDRGDRGDADRTDRTDQTALRPDKAGERADRSASRTAQRGDDVLGPEPRDAPAPAASSGSKPLRYAGLIIGGVGVVATIIGIYDGVQAKDISDQISGHDPKTPWPDNIKDLQDRGQRYQTLQIASLVTGGALVTAGVVMYVLGRPDSAPEHGDKSADRSAMVVPTSNGLAVFGRF